MEYTALSTNAQGASYFFSNVAGYESTCKAKTAKSPPVPRDVGPQGKDKDTIEVTLAEPFAIFPVTWAGASIRSRGVLQGPVAFGKKPVGQGLFKSETEWVPATA